MPTGPPASSAAGRPGDQAGHRRAVVVLALQAGDHDRPLDDVDARPARRHPSRPPRRRRLRRSPRPGGPASRRAGRGPARPAPRCPGSSRTCRQGRHAGTRRRRRRARPGPARPARRPPAQRRPPTAGPRINSGAPCTPGRRPSSGDGGHRASRRREVDTRAEQLDPAVGDQRHRHLVVAQLLDRLRVLQRVRRAARVDDVGPQAARRRPSRLTGRRRRGRPRSSSRPAAGRRARRPRARRRGSARARRRVRRRDR